MGHTNLAYVVPRDIRCLPQPPLFDCGGWSSPRTHQRRCAPRTNHRPGLGRCRHPCVLQSLGQCAVNFGPILLKLKYVTALAPVVDVIASPAAAELGAPCCQKQPTASEYDRPDWDGFCCRAY